MIPNDCEIKFNKIRDLFEVKLIAIKNIQMTTYNKQLCIFLLLTDQRPTSNKEFHVS